MQLSEKIVTPEDLLKVEDYDIEHSAFMKECENLYGPLSDDTFWKYREHLRSTYVYKAINIKGKPFHFVHFNENDPNLIAFTANDKVGKKDGKTFIKPGKYLAQYSSLDNEQIKTIVTNYKHEFVPPEIHYATSADDAVRIYEEGPNSCMQGKGWKETEHPTRIYYGPDISLAYLKNKSGKGVSARSIVRTDRTPNEYIRIYGDNALMEKAFNAVGIKQSNDGIKGCRIPLLWRENEEQKVLLMPYIDGAAKNAFVSKNRDNREYMISGELPSKDGEMYWAISTTPTSGYSRMPDVFSCDICCKLEFKEKTAVVNGSTFCKKCAEKHETIIIDENQEYEKLMTLYYVEEREDSYFKIENKWYSRDGLENVGKYYAEYTREVIDFKDTEICYQSQNRYPKTEILVMNSDSNGKRYFMRKHAPTLSEKYMHSETYEFYSDQLAERLIAEGETHIARVQDSLRNKLEELKANTVNGQNYIPHIVASITTRNGLKEFLRLYLNHFNDSSDYL